MTENPLCSGGDVDETILDPAQQGELPIYYSYVVVTTLGFGDVQPVGALAFLPRTSIQPGDSAPTLSSSQHPIAP